MNSMPQKLAVLQALLTRVRDELASLTKAARATYAAATDSDSKAENKYDTRSLEASYLARGQAQRVDELGLVVDAFTSYLPLADGPVGLAVGLGSLVTLSLETAGAELHFLLSHTGGGLEVVEGGAEITVITPASPLGQRLMGQQAGRSISLPSGQGARIERIS
jgi:transcription elongation GreA/GreB family factor